MDKHAQYIDDLNNKLSIAIGLRYFLESSKSNDWLLFEFGKLDVRKSVRRLPLPIIGRRQIESKEPPTAHKKMYYSLDIATIEILPNYQDKCLSKMIIEVAHIMNPFDITFIEVVPDEQLQKYLSTPAWIIVGENFYKRTDNHVSLNDYP